MGIDACLSGCATLLSGGSLERRNLHPCTVLPELNVFKHALQLFHTSKIGLNTPISLRVFDQISTFIHSSRYLLSRYSCDIVPKRNMEEGGKVAQSRIRCHWLKSAKHVKRKSSPNA